MQSKLQEALQLHNVQAEGTRVKSDQLMATLDTAQQRTTELEVEQLKLLGYAIDAKDETQWCELMICQAH